MKATILRDGTLEVSAENQYEEYVLKLWRDNNMTIENGIFTPLEGKVSIDPFKYAREE